MFVLYFFLQNADDCSCQDGLTCVLTKEFIVQGTVTPVKQCMPEGMEIDVETVNKDENDQVSRSNRFFPLPGRVRK